MKEKRKFFCHLTVLLTVFLLGLTLWHILCLILPYSNNKQLPAYITHSELYNFTYPLYHLSDNDYNLLANYSFSFNILNLICNENTFLLVLIHSSPENFHKRSTIRSTWGNNANNNVKFLYVMGLSSMIDIQNKIKHENEIQKDIIQGHFKDVYRNLTLKHIMSLKYAAYHCPQAKYILKTDDDVFINMPLMKNFLNFDLSPYGTSNLLFCSVKKFSPVLRTYRSKWRVAFQEYPFRTYPTYCPGWVILYSPDILFKLYKSAQNTLNLFWIDDVHITGTLAAKNNITHTDSTSLIISKPDLYSLMHDGVYPQKPFLFGQPDLDREKIKSLWLAVNGHRVPKSALADYQIGSQGSVIPL